MGRLAVITCGPAHAPIDSVRRITNFATGEIGTLLVRELHARGWDTLCFRGEGSVAPAPETGEVRGFTTNESLAIALRELPGRPDAFFHAAALCDFEVGEIKGADPQNKLSSRSGELLLRLRPAPKILPTLRELFPTARIVGWKYELDGSQTDALACAYRQLAECRTEACVINGTAYGPGFGLVLAGAGGIVHALDKRSLVHELANRFSA